LLPGSGVVPLEEFLALLRTIDSRAPLCIEAFDTQRVARIGPVAYAREMADAARALLSRQPD
jgi:sugar phosphate isomerase/epimerase